MIEFVKTFVLQNIRRSKDRVLRLPQPLIWQTVEMGADTFLQDFWAYIDSKKDENIYEECC